MGEMQNKRLVVSVGAVRVHALASGGWWKVPQRTTPVQGRPQQPSGPLFGVAAVL